MISGCSIPVVRALRVRKDRVRFPAARPIKIKRARSIVVIRRIRIAETRVRFSSSPPIRI